MLRFSIFGIPVTVEPWFWVVSFILGGGIQNLSNGREGIISTAIWMIAIFISILIHELGHAITRHKLGGGRVWIKLWAFGGLAYQQSARFSKSGRAAMIAMGPGAGFLFFIVCAIVCAALLGTNICMGLVKQTTLGIPAQVAATLNMPFSIIVSPEYYSFVHDEANTLKLDIFRSLFYINFFWGLINLLPIMPLDGGQLFNIYQKSPKTVYMVGMICSLLVAILGVTALNSQYMLMMFGYFAFVNFQGYQDSQY